jgi:hypothetical protein
VGPEVLTVHESLEELIAPCNLCEVRYVLWLGWVGLYGSWRKDLSEFVRLGRP